MMFTTTYLAFALATAALTNALPFDAVQRQRVRLAPRAKSYSVINVDGGSTEAPEPSTSSTKTAVETIKVTETPSVVTDTVTATVVKPTATPAPAPASTSSSSSSATHAQSTTSTSPSSKTTPKPSVVTVIVTETESPAAISTQYYDDGQWHTYYIVKTFENAPVATLAANLNSSTISTSSTTISSTIR